MMNDSLGKRIKQMRLDQFKKQSEIAGLLGMSNPAYSKIESGFTDVNITRLKQLAAVFRVSPESLITDGQADNNLKTEVEELKEKLRASQGRCMELQAKLIRLYEEMTELLERYRKAEMVADDDDL